jgi:hypothetical protein
MRLQQSALAMNFGWLLWPMIPSILRPDFSPGN